MIDKVLTEMLSAEFGLTLPSVMSSPGWSQGILFGMLSAMGLTSDFNSMDVPTGNPNVLRTSKMREVNSQGLKSDLSLTLETSYEQKYINGIDPGLAMLDIITNLLKMGTSDQKFILNADPKSLLYDIVKQLNTSRQSVDAWFNLIMKFVNAFITGVTEFFSQMKNGDGTGNGGTESGGETNDDQKSGQEGDSGVPVIPDVGAAMGAFSGFLSNLGSTILAGTIQKYRWPLKGSIALMSGMSTTPWHLTIGNPYSPIINIGNVLVSDVKINISNDLGFNDMPTRLDVSIPVSMGRPLGKQEIEKMFNNGYKRIYSKKKIEDWSAANPSLTNATGISASSNIGNSQRQPTL
jgi:hypothetical protein